MALPFQTLCASEAKAQPKSGVVAAATSDKIPRAVGAVQPWLTQLQVRRDFCLRVLMCTDRRSRAHKLSVHTREHTQPCVHTDRRTDSFTHSLSHIHTHTHTHTPLPAQPGRPYPLLTPSHHSPTLTVLTHAHSRARTNHTRSCACQTRQTHPPHASTDTQTHRQTTHTTPHPPIHPFTHHPFAHPPTYPQPRAERKNKPVVPSLPFR